VGVPGSRARPASALRAGFASRRAALVGLALGVLAAAALGPGCSVPDGPNLLLVSFDTTRRDHTSVYGYALDTTPRLRQLAGEGARFELAYAPASSTGPSHATLFTGLYPITHGVRANGVPLPAAAHTLAERLRAAGWDTAGFVSSFVITRRFGFDQGFAHWDEEFTAEGATSHPVNWEGHHIEGGFDRRGDATTDRAIRWLDGRHSRRPFFLFVHYYDPHAPYEPPETALHFPPAGDDDLSRDVAGYDGEIHFADSQLGRLLDELDRRGLADRTLVAVFADHGEGLMQHGLMGHGLQIYEEQVRIPLVMRLPGAIPAGRVVEGPVEMVDVAPTLLALIGVASPDPPLPGRDLSGTLRDGSPLPAERPVYLYRRRFLSEKRGDLRAEGEKFGVRAGRWKYVVGPAEGTRELFDLESDPGERHNVYGADAADADRLAALVERWRLANDTGGEVPPLTEDVRKGLEALGYVE
jgi:arylsulfatase A-like enzyme